MTPDVVKPTCDRWLIGMLVAFVICVICGVIETAVGQ